MPRLDIFVKDTLFLRVSLGQEIVNIGRHSWCEVQLPSQKVSRFHARITPSESGDYWIENLGTFGTRLNSAELEEKQILQPGDRFSIAEYALAYYPEEAPALDDEFLPTIHPG